jgi:hypothetical protein
MNEIEILNEIKNKYKNASLNEADTRFKIIDPILTDVLKWPRGPISLEFFINGNRADYVLKGISNRPILVIESKKNEIYFELPISPNSKNKFQKIVVEKLLSDDAIKAAINQVKEYAEDILAPFAAICNGKTWILFRVYSPLKPWKKLTAYIINDIDYFIDNYTTAINLLGYESVTKFNSLNLQVGFSKRNYQEIFYAKNNITAYNTPVNSNKFAGSLSILSRKYLGIIPETDSEFMQHCYVSNKGRYDELQKDVQGFLHDSLSPYYRNLGFRDFSDDLKGGAFGLYLTDLVKKEHLDNVMILFGGRGSGKSTFLKRFLFYIKPKQIIQFAHITLVDLLDSPQTIEELTHEMWKRVLKRIDYDNLRHGDREAILQLFNNEFDVFKRQMLVGLDSTDKEYNELVREFVKEHTNNIKLFCEKISIKIKSNNKGLIVFDR